MQELILPAQYPMGLVRLRAIAHLTARADSQVRRETMLARGIVLLQATVLLFSVAAQIFHSIAADGPLLLTQAILVAGIAAAWQYATQRGKRIKQECASEIARIQDRSLSPLEVLNARFDGPQEPQATAPHLQAQTPAESQAQEALLSSFQRAASLKLPRQAATR